MAADCVRLGIVGMGQRGRRGWIRALQQINEAHIVAVCDPIESRRLEGAALAGIGAEHAHAHLDDLLARPDIDAVAVVVEPENQADIIVPALAAGKHVICEVPLAYRLEDCWRLVLAVERSGRTFAMAEQVSYAPFVRAWRQLREEGLLGKIIYGEAQYIHGFPANSFWLDAETGRPLSWEEARAHPHARKSRFWTLLHPIWYNPHSLGPLLQALDDRVTRVTCMSTRRQSYAIEEIPIPDVEVALMHTEHDTILRIACGFMAPSAEPHHWYHVLGTGGEVETGRRRADNNAIEGRGSLLWLANHYQRGRNDVTWSFTDFQPGASQAAATGHGGLDYYPLRDFIDSLLHGRAPLIDVYRACEMAGPAIVAGHSAEQGSVLLPVPDFRPGPARPAGQPPANTAGRAR